MTKYKSLIQFYKEILEDRKVWSEEHNGYVLLSEISGTPIPAWTVSEHNFMHNLNKGSYPGLKFSKINIVIGTREEHDLFDNHTDKARKDPRFNWVFILRDYLKGRSHGKSNKFIRA